MFTLYDKKKLSITRAKNLIKSGSTILDIGGESTRPGAKPVSEEEELIGLDLGEHDMEAYSGFQIFNVE